MGIQLAWKASADSTPNDRMRRQRSELMFARLQRPSIDRKALRLGQRVAYHAEPGTIVAINIASLGRWPGHLYPYVVALDCGLVVRCNNLDLFTNPPDA